MNTSGTSRCRMISVAPEPVRLAEIRRFVEETAAEAALDEEKTFDLKVAVSEACANAVEHSGGDCSPLEVCAFLYSDRIVFEISDGGDFRVPAAQRRTGRDNRGLGLPLMVALMDQVCIAKTRGGGTNVSLSLFL
ncbi:MAG: ATP-binding protein [Thermoleophilia bacterium]